MGKTVKCERSMHKVLSGRLDIKRTHPGTLLFLLLILDLVCLCWTTPTYAEWSRIGPEGGDIVSLVIDPANTKTVYAGTYSGGVFKSTNGGKSWDQVNSGLTHTYILTLAIDPVNTQTLYAGAVTWDDGVFESGVFKSTNGGKSWSQVNSLLLRSDSLAIDPVNTGTIYAGTWGDGVFKSTNGGKSWDQVNSGLTNTYIVSLAIDPASTGTILRRSFGW